MLTILVTSERAYPLHVGLSYEASEAIVWNKEEHKFTTVFIVDNYYAIPASAAMILSETEDA